MDFRDLTITGIRQQAREEIETMENEESETEILGREQNLKQASKFDLEQVFLWTDPSLAYFATGQFWEAFGVMDGRYKMDAELRNAPYLLDSCVSLMSTNRDYSQVKEQLKLLFFKLNSTSPAVLWLAQELAKKNRLFASIIVYEICFDMFFDRSKPTQASTLLEDCISGIKNPVSKMVESEKNLDLFVRRRILPNMYAMKQSLVELDGINPQYKCVKTAWVTHGIEVCESNNNERRQLISDTLNSMRETLGDQVYKHQIFGTLCLNIGAIHRRLGSRENAVKYLQEALKCFNLATDFETDDKKNKYLKAANEALNTAEGF